MTKTWAVIKREYLQIIRTKGFIIGTILGPVIMSLFLIVPVVLTLVSVEEQESIGVIDASKELFADLEMRLKDYTLEDGSQRYLLKEFRNHDDVMQLKQELNQRVLSKELSGYIFIPENIMEQGAVEYYSEHVSDLDKTRSISNALNAVIVGRRLESEGLDPEKIGNLMTRVSVLTKKVTKKGVEEETGGTFAVSYFIVLVLYMTLIFYGQAIMRGVLEEKNSRVVEIMLSSVRPFQLMTGKIIGIGAVGLTQYAIWILFGVGVSSFGSSLITGFFPSVRSFNIPTIPFYVYVYFIVFFVLGYFLYSTLFAAIGSMVNSEKEAQQFMMPAIMMLIIPLMMIMFVMRSPDSSLSVVLSLIPFFAPILMLLRVCILLPPFTQTGTSVLLLVLTTGLMIGLVSKIYRVGILMYGKRPSLPEILKWVRYR